MVEWHVLLGVVDVSHGGTTVRRQHRLARMCWPGEKSCCYVNQRIMHPCWCWLAAGGSWLAAGGFLQKRRVPAVCALPTPQNLRYRPKQ